MPADPHVLPAIARQAYWGYPALPYSRRGKTPRPLHTDSKITSTACRR